MKATTMRRDSQVNRLSCHRTDRMTTGQIRWKCERLYGLAMPLLSMLILLLLLCIGLLPGASVGGKTTTIVRHTESVEPHLDGFWTNRTTWNVRWVKYWRAKRIYEPVWKKVWTPTILNEWVPLPNAPAPDAWPDKHNKEKHFS